MPRREKIIRIAVVLNESASISGAVLEGIIDFGDGRGWRLGDATSVDTADAVLRDTAAGLTPPHGMTVTFSTGYDSAGDVRPDSELIQNSASEHFAERGFSGFVTNAEDPAALPSPSACFMTSDAAAAAAIRTVVAAGRSVPGDLAVLGVGDDWLTCGRIDPPLSSVDVGGYRIGRRAAARLDRLLRGRGVPAVELVPPIGVVPRASTDTLAIADADVAAAVRFIRDHAAGPMRVGDVLRAVRLDRRTLERRFQKSLGRSPSEVVRRHRVDAAMRLLRSTTRPVTEIAAACGFRLPQHLAAAFKLQLGQTPSDYRASVLAPSPGTAGRGS